MKNANLWGRKIQLTSAWELPYAPFADGPASVAASVLLSAACVCCACAWIRTVCCGMVAARAACVVCNPCNALAKGTCQSKAFIKFLFSIQSQSKTTTTSTLTVMVPWLLCTALAKGTVIVPWLPKAIGLTICGGCSCVAVVGNTIPGVGNNGTFLLIKKLVATTALFAMVGVANGRPLWMPSVGAAADNPNTALLATASIAWILAVAAAAATAAAVGIEEFTVGPIRAFGGVIARPTRNSWPPKSNKFMLVIASSIACFVEYSMKP